MIRNLVLLLFVASLVAVGCNNKSKEPPRASVIGKVTLDGKEITTGKITFDPQDGSVPVTLDIVDGQYQGRATKGKNKVMISATEKVDMKKKMGYDGPGYDEPSEINILPPRYNSESKLSREVEDGENKFDFDLKKE